MTRFVCVLFLSVFFSNTVFAQLGGKGGYSFLEVPVAARQAAVGGINVSIRDKDVAMGYSNPALLRDTVHKTVSFTYQPYYAGIKRSTLFGAWDLQQKGTVSAGIHFFDYGTITQTDPSGNTSGATFRPVEYALMLGYAHTQGPFSMGVNAKFVHSSIESYNATALLFDIGGVYKHPTQELTVGLVFKNAGFNINNYVKGNYVNVPFDIQLGATFKPQHMPLRLSVTAHHLYVLDIVYNDPLYNVKVNLDGTKTPVETTLSDKMLRHFVIGGELLLTRNFHFRFGYNFLMRRELKIQGKSAGAGLSWGFMLRVKRFDVGFTRAYYHVTGGTSYFTLGININEWSKK